ncbi:hypothetical protein D3C86_1934980 [compost metagenome]
MQDLALQVGHIDTVEVGQVQLADTGRCQVQGDGRAQPAQADDQGASGLEPQLAIDIDLRQENLPAVAQ